MKTIVVGNMAFRCSVFSCTRGCGLQQALALRPVAAPSHSGGLCDSLFLVELQDASFNLLREGELRVLETLVYSGAIDSHSNFGSTS